MHCRAIFNSVVMLTILVSCAYGKTIVSPLLPVIGNKHLEIRIPTGWSIINSDPVSAWHTSSYDCTISQLEPTGIGNSRLTVEILNQSLIRAQMHGDLSGEKYKTSTGLVGVIHTESFEPNKNDWYIAFPIKNDNGALIVRIENLSGSVSRQHSLALSIFNGVRFRQNVAP